MPTTPLPAPKRLSKDLAARILDRAATLDATEEKVDLTTLRAAAMDAGISPDAFERALSETTSSLRHPEAKPGGRVDAYGVASRTFWVGLITGTIAMVVASLMLGPDDDATAGALIGGGGALVGVFVELLRRFRNRSYLTLTRREVTMEFQILQITSIVCGTLMTLATLSFLRRYLEMRHERRGLTRSDEVANRLERIENAVESTAIEVERIAEANRFMSKLLADRTEIPKPSSPPRVITPH